MKKTILKLADLIFYKVKSIRRFVYSRLGLPNFTGESTKAKRRRIEEKFFDNYCQGKGLDIGYGGDPLLPDVDKWDFFNGDAQYLNGIPDQKYNFVYSSHCLEHMSNPYVSLLNWWRVLKPGGYLILYVPHRDLYEKKKILPSNWNLDHKWYFLEETDEFPHTLGILSTVKRSIKDYTVEYLKICDKGHTITDTKTHSNGEYSIEIVISKNQLQ